MKEKYSIFKFSLAVFISIGIIFSPLYESRALLFAQENACEKNLKEAENKYTEGRFDEAIALLTQCLESPNITDDQKQQAFRLMGLTYIAKDYLTEAKKSVEKLLDLVPSYNPDPIYDPPPFINLVEQVKSETVVAPEVTEEKKSNMKWYLIAGGAAAVGLLGILLLAGGGDDDKPPAAQRLPSPPALP
jgi:hypothetical protein